MLQKRPKTTSKTKISKEAKYFPEKPKLEKKMEQYADQSAYAS